MDGLVHRDFTRVEKKFFFPEPFNLLGCCSPWQNYCHLSCMFVFAINKFGRGIAVFTLKHF